MSLNARSLPEETPDASTRESGDPSPNERVADAAGLTYVHEDEPGLRRRRAGRGFGYIGLDGKAVRDPAVLERIRHLAIPPAYEDVWICADPDGHIQATGRDERGRKQYRYHPRWREVRDETKYARMAAFGRALPAIRARVDHDLKRPGLPRDKVLATVVRLLELTLIRVGNDEYARENHSYGLTTFRNRHASLHGSEVTFEFKGKSGVQHKTGVRDRRLARIVKSLQEMRGQRLFQYVDQDGERHAVESADVNAYIHEVAGEHFTAKDFRTWFGTVTAARALALQPPPETAAAAKRAVTLCVKEAAGLLGNTPAVCRSAYIHPAVITAFTERRLPETFATLGASAEPEAFEAEVLAFLDALTAEVQAETGLSPDAQVEASAA